MDLDALVYALSIEAKIPQNIVRRLLLFNSSDVKKEVTKRLAKTLGVTSELWGMNDSPGVWVMRANVVTDWWNKWRPYDDKKARI
jgi:hypothetical protein